MYWLFLTSIDKLTESIKLVCANFSRIILLNLGIRALLNVAYHFTGCSHLHGIQYRE